MNHEQLSTRDLEVLTRIADMGIEEFDENNLPQCSSFKMEKTYLPEKNLHLAKDYNDFKKLLDQESLDRLGKECSNQDCQEKYLIRFPNCYVCYRETAMVSCPKCNQDILSVCSPKCQDILNGKISLIEFRDKNDNLFVVLEDHNASGMILKVIDHKILGQELGHDLRALIGQECIECIRNYFLDNLEDFDFEFQDDDHQVDLNEYFEEHYDMIRGHAQNQDYEFMKNTLIGFKCNQCLKNYTFDVGCPKCDQKELYFCAECKAF